MKDKLHIILIFSLTFIVLVILFIVTTFLRPDSFGEHGHYRWDALNDIFASKIVNQNISTCSKCHNDIYQLHQKDAHYNVPCVDCHGAGDLHVAYNQQGEEAKNITNEQAKLPKEYTLEGCLYCHRKLNAKPSDFPQIDQAEHYKFLHVKDLTTKCIECHSPHEPIFLLTEVNQSKLHPIVNKCTDCHNTKPTKSFSDVANHPKIFDCKDCHSKIVNSFEARPHSKYIECRTCHLFHKENESVGRMYKNGNARFCLLCHENKAFKDDKYPPKIDWPSHLGDLKFLVNINQKICLSCHSDKIHEMDLKGKPNPHSANWRTGHRRFINKNLENKNTTSTCGYCHKKDFCYSCHKLDMPHPEGFLGDHKDVVKAKGRTVCANCHPKEFCTTCHE
jgi:hypothetical protein